MDSNQTLHLKPMYPHSHLNIYSTPVLSVTMPNLSLASNLNIAHSANELSNIGITNETSNSTAFIANQSGSIQANSTHLVPISTNNVCLNNIQIQQLQMHPQTFSENHHLQNHCNNRATGSNGHHTSTNSQMLQIQLANQALPGSSTTENRYSSTAVKEGSVSKTTIPPNDASSSLSNESSTSTRSATLCSKGEMNTSQSSTKRVTSNSLSKEIDNSCPKYVDLTRASSGIDNLKLSSDHGLSEHGLNLEVNNNASSLNTYARGFKCQICNRDFTQKGNLKTHLMTHSGERPYECQTCGKNFTQKGNLDTHVKIHTETKDHKCQYCDRGFTQRGNLKTHIRSIHTKEKPYACGHCGKSFSQKGNMLTHFRTHDKEARFPCNVCGKTFSQKGNLKTHQQRHLRGSVS